MNTYPAMITCAVRSVPGPAWVVTGVELTVISFYRVVRVPLDAVPRLRDQFVTGHDSCRERPHLRSSHRRTGSANRRQVAGPVPGRRAGPAVAAGLDYGLDGHDQRRCADLEYAVPDWPRRTLGDPGSVRPRALGNPAGLLELDVLNNPLWRGAEVPAVNLHATARGVARFYLGLLAGGQLDGVRLLSPATAAEAVQVQYQGQDLLLERPARWTLGMQVDDDGSWGMGGIGGGIGYADPASNHTFAYVTRRLADFDRVDSLVDAANESIDRQ